MTYTADRLKSFGKTIFVEMTVLANKHKAVNLGQGFPDFPAPRFVKEAAKQAIDADINQYAPSTGRPRLRNAIAAKMERHYGIAVNPDTDIVVTNGATEAIFAVVLGLVNPGDEVILFEPYYDSYVPSVQIAGGVPRYYTLRPPDWRLDEDELASLFSDKTKLIVLNNPHNPTGKVFTREELELVASLCRKHDVIAVADEVYEHMVYDGCTHFSLATLPGMAERTVTISSASKTFSVTGWKVGWAVAVPELIHGVFSTHQYMTFCGAAPLQEAIATALETDDHYYTQLASDYLERRDFLLEALRAAGLTPIVPKGTYFIMVDINELDYADDVEFCRYLTAEIGVAPIPPSVFYHNPADGAGLARFAFCKTKQVLEEAANRLMKLRR
ncbi:MAG: aminotransferase class I/II-fold pyridoxal phosphate-dependent enzyme [bacterium]|nr:aminotransferase class I/II-fold pyridoxal phosphate-dependent enzyme [bacterium]